MTRRTRDDRVPLGHRVPHLLHPPGRQLPPPGAAHTRTRGVGVPVVRQHAAGTGAVVGGSTIDPIAS